MDEKKDPMKIVSPLKKKWLAFVRPATLLLMMIFLFSYVSYAWMRREWTPYIEQSGITISTSGSLVFQLDNSAMGGAGMSINKILNLDDDFVLNPVSNRNGGTHGFFGLDLTSEEKDTTYKHIEVTDSTATAIGIQNGYIEFKMALYSPDPDNEIRYIYIHPDSHIQLHQTVQDSNEEEFKKVINCIRVSITLISTGKTIIFVPEQDHNGSPTTNPVHSGVNDIKDPNDNTKYLMDGARFYEAENVKSPATTYGGEDIVVSADTAEVCTLKKYMAGCTTENDTPNPTSENTLFELKADGLLSSQQWIIIRIWAEGTHEDCDEDIAGAQIDLKLKFTSVSKEISEAN